jgi:hypothetical protein
MIDLPELGIHVEGLEVNEFLLQKSSRLICFELSA